MEEEIFQNEYTMTIKLIKEYVYKILCKKIIFMGYIIFVLGIILFFTFENQVVYAMITASFISVICALFTPIIAIKQIEETSKRLNNGKIEKTCIKFSNNIVMDEGKVHLEFEYNQIKQILETKNFIVLKTSEQSAILVFKEGFTIGKAEDFITFIKNKIE